VEKAGQRRRRYYQLTAQGRTVLKEQRSSWADFVNAINRITGEEHADWPQEIRAAIARLDLDPAREALLVEELSQHLADRYNELRGEGVGDGDACRLLRAELNDGKLVGELSSILAPAREAAAPGWRGRSDFSRAGTGSSPGTAAAAAESWVCGGGDFIAGAWDWREHRDF